MYKQMGFQFYLKLHLQKDALLVFGLLEKK